MRNITRKTAGFRKKKKKKHAKTDEFNEEELAKSPKSNKINSEICCENRYDLKTFDLQKYYFDNFILMFDYKLCDNISQHYISYLYDFKESLEYFYFHR